MIDDGGNIEGAANDRMMDSLLRAGGPGESDASVRRIEEVMARIRFDDGPPPEASRSRVGWTRLIGGLGSIAALLVFAVLLGRNPQVQAASYLERAMIVAETTTVPRRFDVRVTPHEHARQRPVLRGTLLILPRVDDTPLLRYEIDRPAADAHVFATDPEGGWHRRGDGPVERFDSADWAARLTGGGLDLLMDAMPAFLARIERDYDVVEIDEETAPRLVASHRPGGRPGAPDRIELVLDPDSFEVQSLVISWDDDALRPPPPGEGGRARGDGTPRGRDSWRGSDGRRPPHAGRGSDGPGQRPQRPRRQAGPHERPSRVPPPASIQFDRVDAGGFGPEDFRP